MEYLLPYLVFTDLEIVGLILFFLFFCLQIRYYVVYYRKPYNYVNKKADYKAITEANEPSVTIVIEAENESVHLAENLPLMLTQNYPDFKVVVVNKGSTDETYELLQSLSLQYPNLYHTHIPVSYDKKFSTRKLALTVGIKAANSDVIIVTESYSRPLSDQWISLMVSELKGNKEVAIGYSSFSKTSKVFNGISRFDNLLSSLQYLSQAVREKPYYGTYRNIAFRKKLFFENKGFASYLGMDGGEEIFIHNIMNVNNTVAVLDEKAFVESDMEDYTLWKQIKKTYSAVKPFLGASATRLFPFEYFSRYIYHGLFVLLIVSASLNQNWILMGLCILLWLIRFTHQIIVVNKAARYFQAGKFRFSILFYELLQPLYNIKFMGKIRHK